MSFALSPLQAAMTDLNFELPLFEKQGESPEWWEQDVGDVDFLVDLFDSHADDSGLTFDIK